MTEFRLTLTTSPDERLDASVAMVKRATGVKQQLITPGIPIVLALVYGLAVAKFIGYPMASAWSVALCTIGGGMIGMSVASHFQVRRLRTLFTESSLFSLRQLVSLSDAGVCFESRTLPSNSITALSRFRNTTLLHFSSTEALVIPDRDLPGDLSPEQLQAQVAKWLKR